MLFPPAKRRIDNIHYANAKIIALENELQEMRSRVDISRSPALSNSQEDLLTDRLLAHPVNYPFPKVKLGSEPAIDNPNRIEIAERLLDAYHNAMESEKLSPLKRDGEDLWSRLIRNELPELISAIEKKDPIKLADFLQHFGSDHVWYGGITTSIDGYTRNLNPDHVALTYLDKLVCLGEALGLLFHENPESDTWGENLHVDIDDLLIKIEFSLKSHQY